MVSYQDIAQAHKRISSGILRSSCLMSNTLSKMTGADVYVKYENMQFTASFKERGALNKLLCLRSGTIAKGVVTASAGNHAKALAYHANRLSIPAQVVMPHSTPNIKVEDTQRYGASVILEGENYDEASVYAHNLAKRENRHYVHAFDDEDIIAGQGSIAIEMLEQIPDLDYLVVQIGGGGMIAGMSVAAKHLKPMIKIVGVQSRTFPAMYQSLHNQKIVCEEGTVAEGIAVKQPGDLTLPIIKQHVDEILLVREHSIEKAVSLFVNIEKTVSEGAGAVGLAALLEHREQFAGKKVGIVLSGGNIDAKILAYILLRDLAQQGRIVRIRILGIDKPGILSEIAALIGDLAGNIIDVEHERIFSKVRVKSITLTVTVEVRNAEHTGKIQNALLNAGYSADLI